jgi:hypothetical protein
MSHKKGVNWKLILAISLILFSIIVFFIHSILFHDVHFLEKYLVFYIGFLPIEVIFVTMILDKLLEDRERKEKLEKLNMVIGVFYSEIGTKLIKNFTDHDPNIGKIQNNLVVKSDWTANDFNRAAASLRSHNYSIDIKSMDLNVLRDELKEKRDFLVRVLENPVLLEHEKFTGLLMAVFHLTEELENRRNFKELPDSDLTHLSGDIKRAYTSLVDEWVDYMHYLKENYPYLFSLAMRTNPFDKTASPIVK